VRNKIKRRIKEIIRTNFDYIKNGWDIVFSVRPLSVNLDYAIMEKEVKTLLKRGRIYNDKKVNNCNNTTL
jgi:ribonuclease P protein component